MYQKMLQKEYYVLTYVIRHISIQCDTKSTHQLWILCSSYSCLIVSETYVSNEANKADSYRKFPKQSDQGRQFKSS